MAEPTFSQVKCPVCGKYYTFGAAFEEHKQTHSVSNSPTAYDASHMHPTTTLPASPSASDASHMSLSSSILPSSPSASDATHMTPPHPLTNPMTSPGSTSPTPSTGSSDPRGSADTWPTTPASVPPTSADPGNRIDGPDTGIRSGEPGFGSGNGEPLPSDKDNKHATNFGLSSNPTAPAGGSGGSNNGGGGGAAPVQKTREQMEADFYTALNNALDAAKKGDPTLLKNFDSFFGVKRDPAEYTAGFYMTQDQNEQRWVDNYFKAADTNHDGTLDLKEAGAQSWAQYDTAQKSDGKLTKKEVLAMVERRADAGFIEFNASGDPQLTALAGIVNTMVEANDKNHDNKLTKEELGEKIWLQYNDAARADGYISQTEAAELVTDRVNMGYTKSTTNSAKGETGVAIDKLTGTTGYNRVFDVSAIEKKLGVQLPTWLAKDGKVSDTELATFINTEVRSGNLKLSDAGVLSVPDSSKLPPLVATAAPPVPQPNPQPAAGAPIVVDPARPTFNPAAGLTANPATPANPDNPAPAPGVHPTFAPAPAPAGVAMIQSKPQPAGQASNAPAYVRDTSDSGFAFPWNAAKSIGTTDIPGTIDKAVTFMNAVEGKHFTYDRNNGTIKTPDGHFISKEDTQALNHIIKTYHGSNFTLPNPGSGAKEPVGHIGNPLEKKQLFDSVTGGAVRIDDKNSSTLSPNTSIAGSVVKPRPADGSIQLP